MNKSEYLRFCQDYASLSGLAGARAKQLIWTYDNTITKNTTKPGSLSSGAVSFSPTSVEVKISYYRYDETEWVCLTVEELFMSDSDWGDHLKLKQDVYEGLKKQKSLNKEQDALNQKRKQLEQLKAELGEV